MTAQLSQWVLEMWNWEGGGKEREIGEQDQLLLIFSSVSLDKKIKSPGTEFVKIEIDTAILHPVKSTLFTTRVENLFLPIMARVPFLALFPKGPIHVSWFIHLLSCMLWAHEGSSPAGRKGLGDNQCWGCHGRCLGEATDSPLLKKGLYESSAPFPFCCQMSSTDRGAGVNSAAGRATGQEPRARALPLSLCSAARAVQVLCVFTLVHKASCCPFCQPGLDRLLTKIASRISKEDVGAMKHPVVAVESREACWKRRNHIGTEGLISWLTLAPQTSLVILWQCFPQEKICWEHPKLC